MALEISISEALAAIDENADKAMTITKNGDLIPFTIQIGNEEVWLTKRQVSIKDAATNKKNAALDKEKDFRQLIRTPIMLLELYEPEIVHEVAKLVANAYAFCNYASPLPKDSDYMVITITLMLKTRYAFLEWDEVLLAVGTGLQGDYGEFYGISALTFSMFFKGYISGGAHTKYIHDNPKFGELRSEKYQLLTINPKHMTKVDEQMQDGVIISYENYLKTGVIRDYGSGKYDWLFQHKILIPTQGETEEYLVDARDQYKSELGGEILDYSDRKKARKKLETFDADVLDTDFDIQKIAKNIALAAWFEKIKADGRDLKLRFTEYWKNHN